jgi:hypothetical protein
MYDVISSHEGVSKKPERCLSICILQKTKNTLAFGRIPNEVIAIVHVKDKAIAHFH